MTFVELRAQLLNDFKGKKLSYSLMTDIIGTVREHLYDIYLVDKKNYEIFPRNIKFGINFESAFTLKIKRKKIQDRPWETSYAVEDFIITSVIGHTTTEETVKYINDCLLKYDEDNKREAQKFVDDFKKDFETVDIEKFFKYRQRYDLLKREQQSIIRDLAKEANHGQKN